MHWRGDFRSNAGSQLGLFMSVSPQCCGATDSCFTFDQISLWRATVWTTSLPVVVKLIIPAWQKHLSVFHVELFFFFPQNIPASSQKKKKKVLMSKPIWQSLMRSLDRGRQLCCRAQYHTVYSSFSAVHCC